MKFKYDKAETAKKFGRRMALVIACLATLIFLDCVFYHVSIFKVVSETIDLATHHYFLTAFVSCTIVILCIKYIFDASREQSIGLRKHLLRSIKNHKASYEVISTNEVEQINKDEIPTLKFPLADVLDDPYLIAERDFDIIKAMKLGNIFKQKVKIFLKTLASVVALTPQFGRLISRTLILRTEL